MKLTYLEKSKITDLDILSNIYCQNCKGIFLAEFKKAHYWIELLEKSSFQFYINDDNFNLSSDSFSESIDFLKKIILENNTHLDWLEHYEYLPSEVNEILEANTPYNYKECDLVVEKLMEIGWHIDYGLDAVLFDLKPMTQDQKDSYKEKKMQISYNKSELDNILFATDNKQNFNIQIRNSDGDKTKWLRLTDDLIDLLTISINR